MRLFAINAIFETIDSKLEIARNIVFRDVNWTD